MELSMPAKYANQRGFSTPFSALDSRSFAQFAGKDPRELFCSVQNAVCKQQGIGLEFPPFVNVPESFHGICNFTTGFDFATRHDVAFHHDFAAENGIAIEPHRSAPVYD